MLIFRERFLFRSIECAGSNTQSNNILGFEKVALVFGFATSSMISRSDSASDVSGDEGTLMISGSTWWSSTRSSNVERGSSFLEGMLSKSASECGCWATIGFKSLTSITSGKGSSFEGVGSKPESEYGWWGSIGFYRRITKAVSIDSLAKSDSDEPRQCCTIHPYLHSCLPVRLLGCRRQPFRPSRT